MNEYQDILYRQRPISTAHARMNRAGRAAQFAPFEALLGLDEQLQKARTAAQRDTGGSADYES